MLVSSTEPGLVPTVVHLGLRMVVADKPPGMPVQRDPTGDPDLLTWARAATSLGDLELVNRLDRPVRGLVVLASGKALVDLNAAFRERRVRKVYRAVVEGVPGPEDDVVLEHAIIQDARTHKARRADPGAGGRPVRLQVHVVRRLDRYSLVEVEPEGGAFHQIRAQLAWWGHPIKGDVKYGARRGEKDRSIALQAASIALPAAADEGALTVEVPLPGEGVWCLFR